MNTVLFEQTEIALLYSVADKAVKILPEHRFFDPRWVYTFKRPVGVTKEIPFGLTTIN
jgi:hypothetical protein